jgi:hypothetical protein
MTELEEEIAQSIGEQIAKEIDKEILDSVMINMLTDEGWTVTTINPAFSANNILFPKHEWYSKTAEWVHLNATGDYKLLRGQWVFERSEDAVMFTLTWS